MNSVAYVLHVGAGAVGLIAGFTALIAKKGAALHRTAGATFIWSMAIMSVFAAYLAIAIPDQLITLFIAILTVYLLTTGWMTVHQRSHVTDVFETIALAVAILHAPPSPS